MLRTAGNLLLTASVVVGSLAAASLRVVPVDAPDVVGLRPADEIIDPRTGETLLPAGGTIDAPLAARIREAGIRYIRSDRFAWAHWPGRWWFVLGLVLGLAGVVSRREAARVAARLARAALTDDPTGRSAGIFALRDYLADAAARARQAASDAQNLTAPQIHAAIDPILAGPCYHFAANRTTLIDTLGMSGFAEVMSAFADGERHLNRAWSAAVDGYPDEARSVLSLAADELEQALRRLDEATARARGSAPVTTEPHT